jgi:predicted ferric reductase
VEFWESFWLVIEIFLFVAYIVVLWHIITDLFRDKHLAGGWKAVWFVFLLIAPFITAIVYLIARGRGMAERQHEALAQAQKGAEQYIRQVAGTSPAEQIATAKALLDSGTITAEEFASIKAKALA